ncbi:hypothetical protein UFOVP636_3 [uncultured Caudovirales phage]|uniref:Uncharacterized protein n=1 Tax=uncultured Caudovirales phage TaxID=2100421 RepID=A0A6J5N7W6_9CAUD|nr:hypothetical protein UFOVP636_3 [uncultured Caudovirales phage]
MKYYKDISEKHMVLVLEMIRHNIKNESEVCLIASGKNQLNQKKLKMYMVTSKIVIGVLVLSACFLTYKIFV